MQKFQFNLIREAKILDPTLPISIPTTESALPDWQNNICRSLPPSQNFGAKKANLTKYP